VLFSKEDTDIPEIDRIRPINVFPTITKLLEGAIMHNLGILTKQVCLAVIKEVFSKTNLAKITFMKCLKPPENSNSPTQEVLINLP
jgi:hypothetical protein